MSKDGTIDDLLARAQQRIQHLEARTAQPCPIC